MLYHSRVSIIILTFSGAEERSKETLSLISLAQRKKERNIHLTRALPYMEGA